jgi:hypothetical protein
VKSPNNKANHSTKQQQIKQEQKLERHETIKQKDQHMHQATATVILLLFFTFLCF